MTQQPKAGDVLWAYHIVTDPFGYFADAPGWTVIIGQKNVKDLTRAVLSDAVKRAGLYEMADAFVAAMQDGLWADATDDKKTENNLRHAVYELVAKAFTDGNPYACVDHDPNGGPGSDQCMNCGASS